MRSKALWSILALIAVLGLTATAGGATSGLITGKQIAPHTINSKNLVNHTIQAHDLSAALIKSLHGAKGARGATGPAGPAGPAGAQGAPGISGRAVVQATYHLDQGFETTQTVTAPAGKVVLGGGVSSATPGALVVEQSYPSGNTWTVTVWAASASTNFTVYAIVASVS